MEQRSVPTVHVDPDDPAEILAYLPYRLGFRPRDSLALLGVVQEAPGRFVLGTVARADLADLADPEVDEATRAMVAGQLRVDRTAYAHLVVYTDQPAADVRAGRGDVGAVVARWLREVPYLDAAATVVVGEHGYRCLRCGASGCCPPQGRSLERLASTAVAAEMVLAGATVAPDRESLGCVPEQDTARRREAQQAAGRERRRAAAATTPELRRWRAGSLARWQRALDARRAVVGAGSASEPAALLGRLGAVLDDPDVRDAVLVLALLGRGPARVLATHEVQRALDGLFTGRADRPDPAVSGAAVGLLTAVASHAPGASAARPLAVLAWLHWWRGDGARADVVVRQALERDPQVRLGTLMGAVLEHGVRPGWALPLDAPGTVGRMTR